MSVIKAREHLKKWGLDRNLVETGTSTATVELAAETLGCIPARIAKTLSFKITDRILLIVTAGDAKVHNGKYKAEFGSKAKMLVFEEVEDKIGHAVGGVCPFGVNEGVEVYLDESLKRFETVFPACGSESSMIELSIPQLEICSEFRKWVDVCKGWYDESKKESIE